MTALFVFPTKPDNKNYKYYNNPRKVLEISDDEVMALSGTANGSYYIIRYDKEWDNLTDAEVVEQWNTKGTPINIQLATRKTGLGYSTTNKDRLIRIVRK